MENIIGRITLETRHCDDNENGKGHGKGNSKRHSRENVTTWHDSGLSDHIPDIMDIMQIVLCRDWLKDVLRRGVAFAASAVKRLYHTCCADNGTTR